MNGVFYGAKTRKMCVDPKRCVNSPSVGTCVRRRTRLGEVWDKHFSWFGLGERTESYVRTPEFD